MLRYSLIFTVFVTLALVAPAIAQSVPPSTPEAKRIQALVDKAAAKLDKEGKVALGEMRTKGGEWWSGDVYVFAYAPDGTVLLNPAIPGREGHAYALGIDSHFIF